MHVHCIVGLDLIAKLDRVECVVKGAILSAPHRSAQACIVSGVSVHGVQQPQP